MPEGLQVMLDGRFSRLETGATGEVEAGVHTFQINTGEARYRDRCACPAGGTPADPVVVEIRTRVSE